MHRCTAPIAHKFTLFRQLASPPFMINDPHEMQTTDARECASSSVIIQLVPTKISLIRFNYLHDSRAILRSWVANFRWLGLRERGSRFAARDCSSLPLLLSPWARTFGYAIALFKDFQHARPEEESAESTGLSGTGALQNFIDKNVSRASRAVIISTEPAGFSHRAGHAPNLSLSESARGLRSHEDRRGAVSPPASSLPNMRCFFPPLLSSDQNFIKKNDAHLSCATPARLVSLSHFVTISILLQYNLTFFLIFRFSINFVVIFYILLHFTTCTSAYLFDLVDKLNPFKKLNNTLSMSFRLLFFYNLMLLFSLNRSTLVRPLYPSTSSMGLIFRNSLHSLVARLACMHHSRRDRLRPATAPCAPVPWEALNGFVRHET